MKIYEAIRKGAMRHEQNFGLYFSYLASGRITGSCALGAALVAALEETINTKIVTMDDFTKAMNSLGFADYEQVEALNYFFSLTDETSHEITYWNDELKMSREEIADRLEEQSKE